MVWIWIQFTKAIPSIESLGSQGARDRCAPVMLALSGHTSFLARAGWRGRGATRLIRGELSVPDSTTRQRTVGMAIPSVGEKFRLPSVASLWLTVW